MPNVKITYNQSINGNKNVRLKGLVPLVSALIEESTQNLDKKKSAIPFLFNEKKSDKHSAIKPASIFEVSVTLT